MTETTGRTLSVRSPSVGHSWIDKTTTTTTTMVMYTHPCPQHRDEMGAILVCQLRFYISVMPFGTFHFRESHSCCSIVPLIWNDCSLRNKCHHNSSEHVCQAKRTNNLAGRNIGSQVEDCFSSIKLEMDVLLENVMKEKGNYSAICWGLFFTSLCNSHMSKPFSPKKSLRKKRKKKKDFSKQREISLLTCFSERRIETQLNYTCWPNVDVSRWPNYVFE